MLAAVAYTVSLRCAHFWLSSSPGFDKQFSRSKTTSSILVEVETNSWVFEPVFVKLFNVLGPLVRFDAWMRMESFEREIYGQLD